jgi:hypothetical protein
LSEYQLSTFEGRTLMLRPCVSAARPQVQVAILSTRGNIIETVTIEAGDVLGFARGAAKVAREANARFAFARQMEETRDAERYRAALARNPWLQAERSAREERGLK